MDKRTMQIQVLKEWDKNPRSISKENFTRLKEKLQKKNQFKPLLVTKDETDNKYIVLAGNMRLKAYRELNVPSLWVSELDFVPKDDGTWHVYLDGEEQSETFKTKQDAMMDWSLTENERAGFYDMDMFANIMEEYSLDWSQYEMDSKDPITIPELLKEYGIGQNDSEIVEDEAPEVSPDPAKSELGKVYQLGRHLLMCGDATKIEDVEALIDGQNPVELVFTDPPYGIDVVKDGKVGADFGVAQKGEYESVINDETTQTAKDAYNLFASLGIPKIILWGGNYFLDFLPASDGWIIWDKRGDSGIKNTFADGEMAWCNFHTPVRIYTQLWNGMIREGEHEKRVHPTQKPISTLGKIIKDFSKEDAPILDTFGGSGSTLIACEQTKRTCYLMELDPKYCDVIRKRYWKFVNGSEDGWEEATPEIVNE